VEFFYLLNIIIFFRLFFLFRDKPVSIKSAFFLSILQIIHLLVFYIKPSIIVFAVVLLLTNLSLFYFEKSGNINFCRFISFLFLIITGSILSSGYFSLEFNKSIIEYLKNLGVFIPSFLNNVEADFSKVNIIIFGCLVLLNEINFLVRYFFEFLKLYPVNTNENKTIDDNEYSAGRVIGMLERIFIFTLVLIGEITVIGFIIAAKGFTRFKELDKRDFAEYVLIGTLLSSFLALIISFIIKNILILN
jgi:hypothetical protein